MIEDKELAQLFRVESAEHLARLDDGLLRLEKTPADQALLAEVFRGSHSMKGAARMLGLSQIESAAHDLESILSTARNGEVPLTAALIERMTAVLGVLRKLVQEALSAAPAGTISADGLNAGKNPEELSSSTPSPLSPALPLAGEGDKTTATEPFRIETVRVETRKLDDLLTLVGELSVIEGRAQHRLLLMDALLEQWTAMERSRRKFHAMLRGAEIGAMASEALHAEDQMLAHHGSRLKDARDAFYEDGASLETTVNTLEERVHAARLLPLSTVFGLFPRMVRDLAKQHGKEVELVIEGGEISVDKRILEEMKDPLMHLLRNAIDHGIELPPERERQGKPRGATVRLRAVREGSSVLLEVRDDGGGLDLQAIRQVALTRGLGDEATLATMNPAQLQRLVFLPGFSTSTFVTDMSGRGVGLDVVRANVEHLKGDIRMDSVLHQGTTMQVRLPLSLATTRLLLAGVGDRLYGLPIEFVHTSRRLREEDIFTLEGRPAFELDGQAVIAPRLAELLGLPDFTSHPLPSAYPDRHKEDGMTGQTVCIVIQVGDERLGLRVDELRDEEEVVAKPLGAPLTRVRNVAGLTILGSGEICAVLNPADLLRSARQLGAEMRSAADQPAVLQSAILLAEDSALVRAMERRILEEAGYEVVAVEDGAEAFKALGRRPFAAVVSDVNMPNMDGLTLTARIRQEPRYKNLPVILVTSLASDEDKQRGLEAGASAYIPKPSFDQRLLLETLERLI